MLATPEIGHLPSTEQYKQSMHTVKHKLRFNSYPSTDSKAILESLYGLSIKFRCHMQEERADVLLSLETDVLRLLLCLSESPTRSLYEPSGSWEQPKPVNLWQEIELEEPLVGEHWRQPDIDYDSSDWEDPVDSPETLPIKLDVFESGDQTAFNQWKQDRYWTNSLDVDSKFDFKKAETLRPTMERLEMESMYVDRVSQTQYVHETNVLREVLMMLLGSSGFIFHWTPDLLQFQVKTKMGVAHLSEHSFLKSMNAFAAMGTNLKRLETLVSFVDLKHPKTIQAFAGSINRHIMLLRSQLSAKMHKLSKNQTTQNTLLVLMTELKPMERTWSSLEKLCGSLGLFDWMSGQTEFDNRVICCNILNQTFDLVVQSQLENDPTLYHLFYDIFLRTFDPYLGMIAQSLELRLEDPQNEFMLSMQACDQELFWKERIRQLEAPSFVHQSNILQIAKSVYLTRKKCHGFYQQFMQEMPSGDCIPRKPFHMILNQALDCALAGPFKICQESMSQFLFVEHTVQNHLKNLQSLYLMAEPGLLSLFYDKLILLKHPNHLQLSQLLTDTLPKSITDQVSISLEEDTNIFSSVVFDYDLPWPVNQIVSKTDLQDYKRILKFLAKIKYSQHCLNHSRQDRSLIQNRLKLQSFLTRLTTFVMHSAIAPQIFDFTQFQTMDELIHAHERMMKRVLSDLLLDVTRLTVA
ncbi:Spc98 family-domain-containing protein [Gorgonomyces haynaldii]|nr:Spc98 family-domain-containing protein [Gorgonomyces haynaldii]